MDEFTVPDEGAQLIEVFADGSMKVRGVYTLEAGYFAPVD
jgi:hypothetical protein